MNRKQTFRVLNRRSKIQSIINDNGGKFFSVKFHKVDGSIRKMTCRAGVKKYLKGGDLSYRSEDKPNLKVVYDIKSKGYRTINLDKVFYIKAGGQDAQSWLTDQVITDMLNGPAKIEY